MAKTTSNPRNRLRALCLALCALATFFAVEARIPEPDFTFFGSASVDGEPLFSGTITVHLQLPGGEPEAVDPIPLASFDVPVNPAADSQYVLRVPVDSVEPRSPGTARSGDPVSLFIQGQLAGTGVVGERGGYRRLNLDTNPPPRLSLGECASCPARFEGGPGITQGVTLEVTVDPVPTQTIQVEYRTLDGTAQAGAGDYRALDELLTIEAGQSSASIVVELLGDDAPEPDETFSVVLGDVLNGVIEDGETELIIRDDDGPATLSIDDATVHEQDGATAQAEFTVHLSRPVAAPVVASYATRDGQARAGLDYESLSSAVTFDPPADMLMPAPGALSATVRVNVLPDSLGEGAESFFVDLLESSTVGIADGEGEGTILDDERLLEWIERERDGEAGVEGVASAVAVAVSGDGRHLYVAGPQDDAIAVFDVDPSARGAMTWRAVVEDQTGSGFVRGLRGSAALALSPDGQFLYATGAESNAVTVFDRNRLDGSLRFVQAQEDGSTGVDGLAGAAAVAVSPDGAGRNVYVAGPDDDAIATFARDELSGRLSFVERTEQVDGLHGVRDLVLSPDAAWLYAVSPLDHALVTLARDGANGRLYLSGVLTGADDESLGLVGARAIAMAPDGRHLYVASRSLGGAVAVFERDPFDGALVRWVETEFTKGLAGASSVVVGPQGEFVYAAGFAQDALVVFRRDNDPASPAYGTLRLIEVQRDGERDVEGVARPADVAVSPGGRQVYVAGSGDDAVALFDRETGQPTNPDELLSDPVAGLWSNDPTIDVLWGGASDGPASSGLDGYSVLFDGSPGTETDIRVDVLHVNDPNVTVSDPQPEGERWFHLRTCDRAANCAETLHLGPFMIDTTAPATPTGLTSPSHNPGTPSDNSTVTVTWAPVVDPTGSGLAGYRWAFDTDPAGGCGEGAPSPPGSTSLVSPALPDQGWFVHVCAVDGAGNVSAPATLGPFVLCADNDGDGFQGPGCPAAEPADCDDGSAEVFPGAPEQCNGLDNDCNGVADDAADSDADGVNDCQDLCAADPDKVDPGACGCGVADAPRAVAQYGSQGSTPGQFRIVSGLGKSSVGTWVADGAVGRVQRFGFQGELLTEIASPFAGDVAEGPFDRVYVTNTAEPGVNHYSLEGGLFAEYGGAHLFTGPLKLAAHPDGFDGVYVLDRGRGRVTAFDGATAANVLEFDVLANSTDIATASNGLIFVSGEFGGRGLFAVYDDQGNGLFTVFGDPGTVFVGIDADEDSIYVTDASGRLSVYDYAGALRYRLDTTAGPVAVDPLGRVHTLGPRPAAGTVLGSIIDGPQGSLPEHLDLLEVRVELDEGDTVKVSFRVRGPILAEGDPRLDRLFYRLWVDVDVPLMSRIDFSDSDFTLEIGSLEAPWNWTTIGPSVLPEVEVDGDTIAFRASLEAFQGAEQVAVFADALDFNESTPFPFDQSDVVWFRPPLPGASSSIAVWGEGPLDTDGDGSADCVDCGDNDPFSGPGLPEICDQLDNDCDGVIPPDEVDGDGDGFAICQADCNDADPAFYPGAPEVCDGRDNDCNGVVPESELDGDLDGVSACAGDCNDADPATRPGAFENCRNDLDDDCNGDVDAADASCASPTCIGVSLGATEGEPTRLDLYAEGACPAPTGLARGVDVIRGDLADLGVEEGSVRLREVEAIACADTSDVFVMDEIKPGPNQIDYYLAREAGRWSYDVDGAGRARIEPADVCPVTTGPTGACCTGTATELFGNGGFEQWDTPGNAVPTGWTTNSLGGLVGRSTENPHSGQSSVTFRRDASGALFITRNLLGLAAGLDHTLSLWVRTDPDSGFADFPSVKLRNLRTGEQLDATGAWTSNALVIDGGVARDGDWTELSLIFQPSANHLDGDEYNILVRLAGGAIGSQVYLDDLSLRVGIAECTEVEETACDGLGGTFGGIGTTCGADACVD